MPTDTDRTSFLNRLRAVVDQPGVARRAKDPITASSIRIWCEAVGDDNPLYQDPAWAGRSRFGGIIAPPASLNMWTLPGNRRAHHREPLDVITELLAEGGFTSVAAVENNHEYLRPLRPGDHLVQTMRIGAVSEEKRTALGQGHFVDLVNEYATEQGEVVGRAMMRILRWDPGSGPAKTAVDAVVDRRGPLCRPGGGDHQPPAAGTTARVRSVLQPGYAVNPAHERPYVIADAELDDGSRLVADVLNVEPGAVLTGMRVEVIHVRDQAGGTLAAWQPIRPPRREHTIRLGDVERGDLLAPWPIPITQASIAALATATYDFNDVHLDRDAAVLRGARDVYMNILGSTGLVNCFLTDWAGPEALLTAVKVRLHRQNHPGDTLTLTGTVTEKRQLDDRDLLEVSVRGYNSFGDHLVARCTLELPR
ncbi:FAS1-like dehydratase domain-containing protein [Dactylosporangium salmoneum]|uniref:MaoC-like domain-containing protein n=1 Tax=Dactylosporangium salmoneum TaxID=53361 RepID=A0ABP5TPL5_9ACTN